jgi:hypothetical protein
MANKFDLEKYLKENKVLSQSGRSLISEARPSGLGSGTGRSKTIAKGGEGNPEVIAKLKAKEKEEEEKLAKSKEARKFKMIDGVPHKFKDGKFVPLKKKMQEMDDDDTGASLEDLYQMDQEMLDKLKRDKKYPDLDDVVDPDDPFDLELQRAMDNDDMMEAKDDEVEDIDIEDDEEMEVEEPADDEPIMGDEISDEQQELQKQLTQAYNSALKMGDEKLTTQLSNTITYYLKTLF